MAFVHKPGQASGSGLKKQIGLVLIIALTLWVMLATKSNSLSDKSHSLLLTVMALAVFFTLVALKKNPFSWILVPGKQQRNENFKFVARTLSALEQLGDQCHVFQSITLEFFTIDFLVLSPNGIFVIQAVKQYNGRDKSSLDKETARVWQRCHMINMLLKKGYDCDLMPVPLLAINVEEGFEHNKVAAFAPERMPVRIEKSAITMDPETLAGFAGFIKTRYLV